MIRHVRQFAVHRWPLPRAYAEVGGGVLVGVEEEAALGVEGVRDVEVGEVAVTARLVGTRVKIAAYS